MKKHVGTFLTVTEEAIQMHEGPNAVGIPKENVARVTVLDKSHRLRNSVIFGAVGAGAGAGIAAAASRCSSSNNTFNFCALGRSVGIGIRLAIELPRLVAPLPNGLNGCRGEERVTFHNTDNCDRPSAGTT